MQLTKESRIHSVEATRISNAPFKIVLEGNPFKREEESYLTLDAETCGHFNIPMSLDMVGKTLACSFESRILPLESKGHFKDAVDRQSIEASDLQIASLCKKEELSPSFGTIPPSRHDDVTRTLKLVSFGGGGGVHFSPLPCPFYRIIVELTDEEYESCRALPPATVMRASFQLK